ncbi:tyrosine-type recombinase/integrase [Roseomonas sp. NAR14]|uniref:Tyrosine-type recombinase/integrase n=1 Tax=Roseomonas acroporae TaxID=2937791 RepID=A0A9X1Y4V7_9PROT|nr:tyrosine-type recombinase/integrase [Roseomonas acroporae]MCK8784264.1 tyrosine-type recombinase/integrase [Roseomonas acroporae]
MGRVPGSIERRRRGLYAVLEVPIPLRAALGTKRLRKTLGTRDTEVARARLPRVLAELHERVQAAQKKVADPRAAEALELREQLTRARSGESFGWAQTAGAADDTAAPTEEEAIRDHVAERAQAIEEAALREGRLEDEAFREAKGFMDLATGATTPLDMHTEDWLSEPGRRGAYPPRTKLDRRRAVAELKEWLGKQHLPATIEAVTRKAAGRFVTQHLLSSGRATVRVTSIVSQLSSYWAWMIRRGVTEGPNPWEKQAPRKESRSALGVEDERPYTDAEVVTLLTGPAEPVLKEFMLVAALSGMRREEIGRLTVKDCQKGVFAIPKAKSKAGERVVPIHPELAAIVARRLKEKEAADFLFHELGTKGKVNDRTDPIGKRFKTYREGLGVDEKEEGRRRSRVNFHSWRRWFITAALQAGQQPHVVEQVVGHAMQGMTLGAYFGGDREAALRACVEAVRLPHIRRQSDSQSDLSAP